MMMHVTRHFDFSPLFAMIISPRCFSPMLVTGHADAARCYSAYAITPIRRTLKRADYFRCRRFAFRRHCHDDAAMR